MPDIQAFCGIRYDLGHVGNLSDVVAPPYDVIDAALQDALYKRHPANVVRLILNREEPGDDAVSNRYTRAAQFLRNWKREGLLFTEPHPAIYVYHQSFTYAGRQYTRRGFMCRARLSRFGEGDIYPHEETLPGPKADRLKLFQACRANLSQVFGLYPDPANQAQETLDRAVAAVTPMEAADHLGVVHRMWAITDLSTIGAIQQAMSAKPIFIADGHHRYETACNYRDGLAESSGSISSDHPANFVLMMCVGMSDPGMIVLPTHRLFRGMPAMNSAELTERLGECFSTRLAGEGSDLAERVWNEIALEGQQTTLGFFTAHDERWLLARLSDAGRARMAEIAADHSPHWQGLGVALLHRLVVEQLLNGRDLPKPKYVHTVEEVIEGLDRGDDIGRDSTGQIAHGGRFNLAALVMPATLEHIRSISVLGERMPAKSTYFYPKLLSGLVINPLE